MGGRMTDLEIVKRLRKRWWTDDFGLSKDDICSERNKEALEAADEIERLRGERDEARRRLCVELLEVEGHPFGWRGAKGEKGIAERLGWDCFKGDR
jgi:hypothetical protein